MDNLIKVRRSLTSRETEVLTLLASGRSCKEIAGMLEVSHKTVECHRAHIMEKLEAKEIGAIVRYAIRSGLIVCLTMFVQDLGVPSDRSDACSSRYSELERAQGQIKELRPTVAML
jgi:DNA-binding CsgD family transcriptional regulator